MNNNTRKFCFGMFICICAIYFMPDNGITLDFTSLSNTEAIHELSTLFLIGYSIRKMQSTVKDE